MSTEQPSPGGVGPTTTDAIDRATLAQLEQLDPTGSHQIVRRVLETYERSLAKCMVEFRAARESGDFMAIGRLAHTLRSSSASVGALGLSGLCRQVEAWVRDGRTEGLRDLMDSLQSESERVRSTLEVMLERKGSAP